VGNFNVMLIAERPRPGHTSTIHTKDTMAPIRSRSHAVLCACALAIFALDSTFSAVSKPPALTDGESPSQDHHHD
jgi:hypothetical protein